MVCELDNTFVIFELFYFHNTDLSYYVNESFMNSTFVIHVLHLHFVKETLYFVLVFSFQYSVLYLFTFKNEYENAVYNIVSLLKG